MVPHPQAKPTAASSVPPAQVSFQSSKSSPIIVYLILIPLAPQAIYALLPFVLPLAITLAIIRLHLSSRSSRARIESLKKDESHEHTLIHILAHLEKAVEADVVNLIEADAEVDAEEILEDPESTTPTANGSPPPEVDPTSNPKSTLNTKSKSKLRSLFIKHPCKPSPPPRQPLLTTTQLKIIASLNSIPQLKKELAYFGNFRNAHAVIVCRDMKRFKAHAAGEGVVRHWADQFVL